MKIPRGNTRKLIIIIGEIQELAGKSLGVAMYRDRNQAHKMQELLNKLLDLCIEATGMYAPVKARPTQRAAEGGKAAAQKTNPRKKLASATRRR